MPGHRNLQIEEDIKRELADIIRTMKDPRVSGIVSVLAVDVTKDLSYAKVYISSVDGIEAAKRVVEGLNSGAGYIKRELIHRLSSIRRIPDIKFIADNSIEKTFEITKTLEDFKR